MVKRSLDRYQRLSVAYGMAHPQEDPEPTCHGREEGCMTAYVLIQKQSSDAPLSESLREIPGIVSAEDTTGAYDAIAVARSGSSGELADIVVSEIRRLPGVTHALLAPLIRDWGGDREGAGSNGSPQHRGRAA
jgi:DNA-binding Lrp family transcriptional regulator